MKKRRLLAMALSAVLLVGSLAVLPTHAAGTIRRVGSKTRTVTVGKEFELEVRRNGISENNLRWSIGNTSIVKFEDNDRYDDDVDLKAVKAGTTKVTCKNLITGGKITYTVTVKEAKKSYYISRVGKKNRSVEVDDDIELRVKKGSGLKNRQVKWTIADTSILRFDDGDRYGAEVEVEGLKKGTTKVTCHNLYTGGKITYTVKVVPDYD